MQKNQYTLPCCITLLGASSVAMAQETVDETVYDRLRGGTNFFELGAAYNYSDNILKEPQKTSGNERSVFAAIGYQAERPTTNIHLNYRGNLSEYNVKSLNSENYWIGRGNIVQQILGKNLVLSLDHYRHRYLIDQNLRQLPDNLGNRDVFTVSPIWRIAYSDRAYVELGYLYIKADFSDSTEQNSERSGGYMQWNYNVNDHIAVRAYGEYEKAKFNQVDIEYDQYKARLGIAGIVLGGNYTFDVGRSEIDIDSTGEKKSGLSYQFSYLRTDQNNEFQLQASRALTDTSIGIQMQQPEPGDNNFSLTHLLWSERAEALYRTELVSQRIYSTSTLFWSKQEPLASRLQSRPLNTIYASGIRQNFIWRTTEKLDTKLTLQYQDSDLYGGSHKEVWNAGISGTYKFNQSLRFILGAKYRDYTNYQLNLKYQETRLSAQIIYRI